MDGDDGYVEVPIFSGEEDPQGWIAWVKAYFIAHGFTEENKIAFAYGFIEGKALIWFEQHDGFNRWSEIKEGLLLRFGTGKEAELLRDRVEIRQTIDELKQLRLNLALIVSKQTTLHDYQGQLDDNMDANLAKTEMLVPRGVDTHLAGSVFEEQRSHKEHVALNLANSDKEDHAHQVFDQMSKKSVKRKKKKRKRFKYKRWRIHWKMLQTQRENEVSKHMLGLKTGMRVHGQRLYTHQVFDKVMTKEMRYYNFRMCKYKPRKWEEHKIQSHMLRNLKSQIMGIMKGCRRVKSCGVVLDKLLYNNFSGFKYKDKDLHMEDILQILKKIKFKSHKTWTMGVKSDKTKRFQTGGKGHKFRHKHIKLKAIKKEHKRTYKLNIFKDRNRALNMERLLQNLNKKMSAMKPKSQDMNAMKLCKRQNYQVWYSFHVFNHGFCLKCTTVKYLPKQKKQHDKYNYKNVEKASCKGHKFRHKHKKKVMMIVPLHNLRVFGDQIFKVKKQKLYKSTKIKHMRKKNIKVVVINKNCLCEMIKMMKLFSLLVNKKRMTRMIMPFVGEVQNYVCKTDGEQVIKKQVLTTRFGHLFWLFRKKHIMKERLLVSERLKNEGKKESPGKHLWSCTLDMSISNTHLENKLLNTMRLGLGLEWIQTTQHNKQQQRHEDVGGKKQLDKDVLRSSKLVAKQFSNSNLEDKVDLKGGSIDRVSGLRGPKD